MIEIQNLWVYYGRLVAVRALTVSVPEGSICALIGPNGAGKTSTIRVLATLLRPAGGIAKVAGRDVTLDPIGVRRVLGYVPDAHGVYDTLTVEDYLDFFASTYGIPPAERKRVVEFAVELTDLKTLRLRKTGSLSRGMRQRLSVARALVHDPKVLVLDEPASGLDPRARIEFRALLKELRAMGKTLLISSHILTEL
jgi:ABC-2 type transport system ATP-binding protein